MVTAIEENNNQRCPHCNLKAGELKIEHKELGIRYYECLACGYIWQEVDDINDWNEAELHDEEEG